MDETAASIALSPRQRPGWNVLAWLAIILLAVTSPALAQTVPPPQAVSADPALTARIGELVGILNGTGDFDAYFAPSFRTAVPKDKWATTVAQMTAQMGQPLVVDSIRPISPLSAFVRLKFERGIVNFQIYVAPDAPHPVAGLLITGAEVAGDSFDRLAADFRALPGSSGFGVYVLGGTALRRVAGVNADAPAPLGSAFKLWVLGELARSIAAGGRHWADVVPVGPPSLPSGITQSWPAASPVTLQTLATLMISISDNTATDTLVTLEGATLDRFVASAGAPGLAPILTTRQMFAIKSAANADLAARWAGASPAARRRLLDASAARLAATSVDVGMFSGKPVAIDTLEWFASPAEAAAMLDRLRTRGGDTVLAILAVNPGTDATTRARFDYVGFKGGSEPGVITLNYLVRRNDGRWLAVTGNWHRSDAAIDTLTFTTLMNRALALASGPLS